MMRAFVGYGLWFAAAATFLGCGPKQVPPPAIADATSPAATESATPVGGVMDPAEQLLNAAIAAHGGLEKLKAAATGTYKSKGAYMGIPYQADNVFRIDSFRMDITNADGSKWVMTMGIDQCWSYMEPVVVPCPAEELAQNKTFMETELFTKLWPLKDKTKYDLKIIQVVLGDKTVEGLEVTSKEGYKGELAFDPASKALLQMTTTGKLNGQEGKFVYSYENLQDFEGLKLPGKMVTTFNGQPYMEEEISDFKPGAVDDKQFEKPAQVADGTQKEKELQATTAACTTLKGPYEGIGASLGKLNEWMGTQKLMAWGAPFMIYIKAPPTTKDAKDFVTEVCFPISDKSSVKVDKKSAFQVKALPKSKALIMYGVGDYTKKSGEIAGKLADYAKKSKKKVAGPMRQVTFMKDCATDCVSEMQLPVK